MAGLVRMMVQLIKKHPFIAAEVILAGAGRAGVVGYGELSRRFAGRIETSDRKTAQSVPSVPLVGYRNSSDGG
ncbi:hypothetical protein [Rhizobium mesosinicum]|uniref:Uncharacterized protein n=1 Tax=Rhizobium mesosinicum TaxID=335017 RepID=A0ABS7GYD1_9HYPH|nr:hypothetical protein [Rhizobium mesosinicum]MBW9054944.1 hypothetical protein [Rhizobium mesosinicum]